MLGYRRGVPTPRTRHRPALIVLVVVAAVACLALGYWQWVTFESAGGTGQNLGYAFQWPLFAGFVVYAYRKFVQLEDEDPENPADSDEQPREIPADLLPSRPAVAAEASSDDDAEARRLDEYNSYLAELERSSDPKRSST
jgi:DNA-binding transcriptional regulator of glucitol operon